MPSNHPGTEPPASASSASAASPSGSPRAQRRHRLIRSPGKIIVLAIIGNLIIAGSVAAAVAPVETSQGALNIYDALPQWLRSILGDTTDEGGETQRGWLGAWLSDFHANALKGNPRAQLGMPLELTSTHDASTWTADTTTDLTWVNHGATLTYHLIISGDPDPPETITDPLVQTTDTTASVPLSPGENWIHLQPTHRDRTGKVSTLGPLLSDPDPPTAPTGLRVVDHSSDTSLVQVDTYHFTLEWESAEARSGITAYHLERRVGGGNWAPLAVVDAENTTHALRNIPNGLYDHRVRAESAAGLLSEPSSVLGVRVDAQGGLQPPDAGQWHYGINAVYDSVLHVWDISDPSIYSTVDEIHAGNAGLTPEEVELYTGPGWGITLDNSTMRATVADLLGAQDQGDRLAGGERNALEIGLSIFEWMFNEVDYDFTKFESTQLDLLRANEVLDAGGGICGDLTALFVTLMRIAGVPARPVHGYLINDGGATDQDFQRTIGGFHMWPEIYVGGDARNGPGGGWIPIDVSGVTGPFKPELLHVYFGVANPNYLQLGVQRDLGDESLGDDHERNRWNVWANLRHWTAQGNKPQVTFEAEVDLVEHEYELGHLWFTPGTNERVWCPLDDEEDCRGVHTNYFPNVRGHSKRSIDYGAVISWTGNVHELELTMRYPLEVGPTQVVMWTAYEVDPQCNPREGNPEKTAMDYLKWVIPGTYQPCA